MDLVPVGHKANHNPVVSTTIIDPIYQSQLVPDSEGGRDIFMVGEEEQPAEKTSEEIAVGGHKMHIFTVNIPTFHSRYRR
jgi:hypothetical protein